MASCGNCSRSMPDNVVSPLMTNDGVVMMCALCALAEVNRIHGLDNRPFNGELARSMFNEARAHVLSTGQDLTEFENSIPE